MNTIGRIWKTRIDAARADEYERFAREVSLPMFQQQAGFEGVVMLRDGADSTVITFWRSAEEAEALGRSPAYRQVVAWILDTGLITGEQSVALMHVHLSTFR